MVAGITSVDAVVAVLVDRHVEGDTFGDQEVGEVHGVLHMHVVIGATMDEEELTLELLRYLEGGGRLVARGVLLWCAHEALRVDRVVVAPVCDGGDGDTSLEDTLAVAQTHQRHVATEAPAVETDAVSIDVGLLAEPLRCRDLVFDLLHTEVEVGALTPLLTASARTTWIDADDDVALAGEYLLPAETEGIEYLL